MCSCDSELEITAYFLLHCQNHKLNRSKLIKNVYNQGQTPQKSDDDESMPFSIVQNNSTLI